MDDSNTELVNQIFNQYKNLMFQIAYDILGNKEDALQMAIEKLLLTPYMFEHVKSQKCKNYIRTITRNAAIDIYRKRAVNQKHEISLENAIDLPALEMTSKYDNDAYLALSKLPKSYQEVLTLKYKDGYKTREIASLLNTSETNIRKRLSRAKQSLANIIKKTSIFILCLVVLAITEMAVNAATGGKFFDAIKKLIGAEIITEENRDLIGKETHSTTYTYTDEGYETPECVYLSNSKIIDSVSEKAILPRSVSDIRTLDGTMPEIIVNVNSCAVLYQTDYSGWHCTKGDTLYFNFSKYPHETKETQQLIIGYVLNGVMHEGSPFDKLNGCYQLSIKESGEYYIYLFNLDLDHLSLKSGTISITPKQTN